MKLIVDDQTPLTVLDQNGKILFEYNPNEEEECLRELGFSEGEIKEIKQLLDGR